MLAYRHAFHAGNHGDVLKHLVLVSVLQYMTQKAAPLAMLDTHAGAGGYSLESAYAERTGEALGGIGALWPERDSAALPEPLRDYLALVRRFKPRWPAEAVPRLPRDRARPAAARRHAEPSTSSIPPTNACCAASSGSSARNRPGPACSWADGFGAFERELPPPSRRGLVLIDPSYEIKTDYVRVLGALRESLRRFATGTVILWFPQLQTVESRQLAKRLMASAAIAPKGWLLATLSLASGGRDGFGMVGSSVLVCNPPFRLAAQLRATLPLVVEGWAARRTPASACARAKAPRPRRRPEHHGAPA